MTSVIFLELSTDGFHHDFPSRSHEVARWGGGILVFMPQYGICGICGGGVYGCVDVCTQEVGDVCG
jgi:hypothetical protein